MLFEVRCTIFHDYFSFMNYKKFSAIFFLIFFVSFESIAKSYFEKDYVNPTLIDPPFFANSKEWKNEVKEIIKIQKNLRLEDLDEALVEKPLKPETLVLEEFEEITRENYPKTYHLLDRVGDTSKNTTENVKNYWKQTRPYLSDVGIEMLISPSSGYSYPSGHSTGSHVYAHVLGLLFPQRREDFLEYAGRIAQRRVIVGMHFPKDLIGGKQLAMFIVGGLVQNSDFKKDLEAAREELELKVLKK